MPNGEVEIIEVAEYKPLERLKQFAIFLTAHPKDIGQTQWLKRLKEHVNECKEQTKTVHQGKRIICMLDDEKQIWQTDQSDRVDLFALPFDILYCLDTTQSDNLEPVYAVAKVLQRDGGPQEKIWDAFKNDQVVIISRSTSQDVEEEAESVRDLFTLALGQNEVLKLSDDELPLTEAKFKKKVANTRIIWMHDLSKERVLMYLRWLVRNLPTARNLIVHYIGPVEQNALTLGGERGQRIDPVTLAQALDLGSEKRTIKLFYVSPHYDDRNNKVLLPFTFGSFVHKLLKDAPQLADMVWFRWSLPEEDVTRMAQSFYRQLVGAPYCTSQAVLTAKSEAYRQWKSDTQCYYAWAAPVLITQRCKPSGGEETGGSKEAKRVANEISKRTQP